MMLMMMTLIMMMLTPHRAGLNADSVFFRSFDRSTEGRNRLKFGPN